MRPLISREYCSAGERILTMSGREAPVDDLFLRRIPILLIYADNR